MTLLGHHLSLSRLNYQSDLPEARFLNYLFWINHLGENL